MASNLGRSTNWARYIDWPTVWLRLTNISFSKLWVGICIHLCEPIDLFRETFCSKTFQKMKFLSCLEKKRFSQKNNNSIN